MSANNCTCDLHIHICNMRQCKWPLPAQPGLSRFPDQFSMFTYSKTAHPRQTFSYPLQHLITVSSSNVPPSPSIYHSLASLYHTLLFLHAIWQQVLSSCWDGRPFGHNKHGPKSGGCSAPPFLGEGGEGVKWVPIWYNVAWAELYLHAKFHLDASNRLATIHQRH